MAKKKTGKLAGTKVPGKVRAVFYLDAELVGEFQMFTAQLKHQARLKGKPVPSMSQFVEGLLRAELAKRKKRGK